ncbi:similar to Saccharomyces cerevisiae YOR267C HRK1 Protein kinase implicated in activation of the plasma membrane H(+)-ATPase Pma1p in response to glucose metabolism [Maudiozyma saulgeensis]|uniref:non-specific serine/threonine protein kinase n=1 Tax=Maudiozyma saulgeensis TaxID=1789683 RepID=A0A1X7R541_9SACH|nr:similar to Saccharomyces cerevisiae YOR267C HRK1 Protein kinase implicated in activation of the plasma membrane H(+)-ATPase Pma1p in response to glucose metabolism [Kazachstania saulgeensis]
MPILGRNPFVHHHSSSSTHLNENVDSNGSSPNRSGNTANSNSNNNSNNNNHSHVTQPPIRRSSKSFLSFMSRKPSLESIRSEKSTDSLVNSPTSSHVMNSMQDSHQPQHTHNLSHGHMHDNHMSPKPTHSMVELKRFFRSSKILSMTHGHNNNNNNTNNNHLHGTHGGSGISSSTTNVPSMSRHTPTHSKGSSVNNHHPHSTTQLNLNSHFQMTANDHHGHTQSAIPPSSDSVLSLSNTINIYHDDTILAQKYGRLGKTLGSGAGGSVKVLVRPSDNATFAVKEFRPRKANESVKQYAKKCTAEFCIGSSLHHPNIVETIDIFSDSNQFKYFQVMEFLPIDFFAVVMTGQMSRGEINCCLKQLCEGVRYLHSMGLAHRDLKLDNCCMTEHGILKIIDFGSAVVFKYPFEDDQRTHNAHGIVGSDPYLAPEVITSTKSYDPQAVDVWSIGIIFCCMMLKRFPWKAPKLSDDNFKLYSMPDDIERDYTQSAKHHEQLLSERRKHRERMNHPEHCPDDEKNDEKCNNNDREEQTTKGTTNIKQLPTPQEEELPNNDNNNNNNNNDQQEHLNTVPEDEHDKGEKSICKDTNDNNNTEKVKIDDHNDNKEHQHSTDTENNDNNQTLQHNETAQDNKSISSSRTAATTHTQHNGHPHKRVIHGPYRLLRLLPHASRPILSRILEIDPSKRATLNEVFDDVWFDEIPCCTMDNKKTIVRAHGHHHTIVRDGKTFKI